MLAFQLGFVERDTVVAAMAAWTSNRSQPLGQILVERGVISADRLALLEPLVTEHIRQHGNPQMSLAAICSASLTHHELESLDAADLSKSIIALLSQASGSDTGRIADVSVTVPFRAVGSARFEILRPYAQGGLGEVFVARDVELNREVALKEIHQRLAQDSINRSRFVREAEITGRLEHPGIVPVYGLGQHADGRPYYAMRFVHGDTLKRAIERFHGTSYADSDSPRLADTPLMARVERRAARTLSSHSLEFRELLSRFVAVCHAVGYAHSRGIIHRDIKPSNIILGKFGETLIVDWGLAKSLGTPGVPTDGQAAGNWIVSGWSSDSGETVAGTAVGTPAFMSPEQAVGRLEDLAPATDVYGLGATFYCLLTGQPPFAGGYLGEMLQQVERGEFHRPRAIRPEVPGALEAICLKAMAKEPRDRYFSAQDLAADVDHWLADEPVSAWREPRLSRLARWARRHRALVASAAALFLATTIGLSVGAVLIAREQARTEQAEGEVLAAARMADGQAKTANAMSKFLIDMFEEPTPYKLFGQRFGSHKVDPASLATLERGARQLTQQLDDQPLLKAGLLAAIGRAHTGTATFEKAGPLLEQALAIRRRELPPDDPQIADNLEQLGHVYLLEGRTAETEHMVRECISVRRARLAESDEGVVTAKADLGLVLGLTGDAVDEAERIWREVLATRRASLEPNDLRIAEALMGLAGTVSWGPEVGSVSRPLESSVLLVEAIKILNTHEQIRDLGMALSWAQRAIVFRRLGAHARAADAFKESLNMLTRLLGDDHVLSILSLHEHAQSLFDAGRREEAGSCYDGLLAYYETRGVPFVSAIVESTTLREIAKLRKETGELDQLEQILHRVVAKQKELTGYRSQNDAFVIAGLVAVLREQGKSQEANELVDDYVRTLNVLENLDLVGNVRQRDTIVELLRSVGRVDDAETVAQRSLASLRPRLVPPMQGK